MVFVTQGSIFPNSDVFEVFGAPCTRHTMARSCCVLARQRPCRQGKAANTMSALFSEPFVALVLTARVLAEP